MKGRTSQEKQLQKSATIQEQKLEKSISRTSERKLHKHVFSDAEKVSGYESMRMDSGCSSISLSSSSQLSLDSGMYDSTSSISLSKYSFSLDKNFSSEDSCTIPDSELQEKWEIESTCTQDSGLISDAYCLSASGIGLTSEESEDKQTYNLKEETNSNVLKEIFCQDHDGDTLLHLAVVQGFLHLVKYFVRIAPHPDFFDICNDLRQTPLHLAVLTSQPKIVRVLIVAGATIDLRDRHGNTALHIACRCGDMACLQALTVPIQDKEIQELGVQYPLCQQYISDELLELRNYEGQSCVHISAIHGHKAILEYLKKCGANINAQEGKSGKTALHIAVDSRKVDLVRFLLSTCQANAAVRNYAGQTPLSTIISSKSTNLPVASIILLLKSLGGEQSNSSESESDLECCCGLSDEDDDESTNESSHSYNDVRIDGHPL